MNVMAIHHQQVKPRTIKKREKLNRGIELFMYWMLDLRGFLLEADHENIDLCIIRRQFKRKLKRMKPKYGTVTRLQYYCKVAVSQED